MSSLILARRFALPRPGHCGISGGKSQGCPQSHTLESFSPRATDNMIGQFAPIIRVSGPICNHKKKISLATNIRKHGSVDCFSSPAAWGFLVSIAAPEKRRFGGLFEVSSFGKETKI